MKTDRQYKKYTFTSAVNDERVQDDTGQKFSYLIG